MLVALVALLVAGTGIVLIPRDSGTPPPITFTENARVGALEDTLRLRESATVLAEAAGPDTEKPVLGDAVTLLTTHARALLDPAGSTSPATTKAPSPDATRATFVAALSVSGRKRLTDAREADGGIARLLAAVGSAQLLQAEKLAAAWQLPVPKEPATSATTVPAATPSAAPCPSVSPTPAATSATTDAALAAMVRSQQEAIYAYQVALKRLDSSAAAAAARDLQTHELALQQSEALSRANCGDVPASEAGYRLPAQFAKDPAASLAALESTSLLVFGDLIALSTADARTWAVDGLLAASRRSMAWGADLPALPGLKVDAGGLPSLPTPGASSPSAGG
ncbi:ferritin-like domain-containing protein [Arthrobacter sp. AK01]|uniref:DUF4439 domain-containing protein n=1 Tax=Arthrobacter sp. AK01 TaxID=2894084 RepID=UPI001E398CB4|nr:DUF4439 domain-containing protein [Arthrobacter sp. AK01]MCD4852474.1 ferritin-like domain-containing protein [Arthrobacter sp. AK01]